MCSLILLNQIISSTYIDLLQPEPLFGAMSEYFFFWEGGRKKTQFYSILSTGLNWLIRK